MAPGHKILIPTCVLDELEKLNNKQSNAAIEFCKKMEKIDIGRGYADDLLVKSAEMGYLVATNDKEILENLKEKRINALRTREKNKLIMTEKEL